MRQTLHVAYVIFALPQTHCRYRGIIFLMKRRVVLVLFPLANAPQTNADMSARLCKTRCTPNDNYTITWTNTFDTQNDTGRELP